MGLCSPCSPALGSWRCNCCSGNAEPTQVPREDGQLTPIPALLHPCGYYTVPFSRALFLTTYLLCAITSPGSLS